MSHAIHHRRHTTDVPSSRSVAPEVTGTPGRRDAAESLARRLGTDPGGVRHRVAKALARMTTADRSGAVKVRDRLGASLTRAYRVEADHERIKDLAELGQDRTLVFLPSHRSYLDPLILRSALRAHGFPAHHVIGGVNAATRSTGPLLCLSGPVFIPRSLDGVPFSRLPLRRYVAHLVGQGSNLEWYLEGGRSRSGRMRPPRLGLLSHVMEAVEAGEGLDAHLIPVSISYDELHEVADTAARDQDAPKRPESLRRLLRHLPTQGRAHSTAHVRFGAPLSVRDALDEHGSLRVAVPATAAEICRRIDEATPVTARSLILLALLGAPQGRALTVAGIRAVTDPLVCQIRRRRFPAAGPIGLDSDAGVRRTLADLEAAQVVSSYSEGQEPVHRIAPGRELLAASYRNQAAHHCVPRAVAELLLMQVAERRTFGVTGIPWPRAQRLRDILAHEFSFASPGTFAAQLSTEIELLLHDRDPLVTAHDARAALRNADLLIAPYLLQPIIEAYRIAAHASAPSARPDEAEILDRCMKVARQYRLEQRLSSPEALSTDLFRKALRLIGSLPDPTRTAPAARPLARLATDLDTVADQLNRMRALAHRSVHPAPATSWTPGGPW